MQDELLEQIDRYVDDVWEDVVSDITALVSHPSIANAEPACEGAPFGAPVRSALDCALGIAERLGYAVSDDEGYMGMADIPGEVDDQLATIAHVDVVPAGPGWATDPFTVVRRDGWLLGRGVIDDKGPAVLSLYAGAFMLKHGIKPRYTFRALLGCDEEVGMSDVHHYLDRYPMPAFLFTPDAEFPVCNAEKGNFGAIFTSAEVNNGVIERWSGAEASNAIPSESVLELAVDAAALTPPCAHADRVHVEALGAGSCRITAHGIGGHASMPEGTLNAIGLVVDYLLEQIDAGALALDPSELSFVRLVDVLTEDTCGAAVGVKTASDAFGPLTINAGTIKRDGGHLVQSIDIRYPDSTTADEICSACEELAQRFGAAFALKYSKPPFSTSADSPAVQALLATYRDVTGRPAEPFSMGGGTYARNFARAVSFGPEDSSLELPGWAGTMHGPNEAANEQLLKDALKMYIVAILRLQELDL